MIQLFWVTVIPHHLMFTIARTECSSLLTTMGCLTPETFNETLRKGFVCLEVNADIEVTHISPRTDFPSATRHVSCAPLMKWEKLGCVNAVLGELSLPVPYQDVPPGSDSDSPSVHSPCLLPPDPSPPFCRRGAGNVFFFSPT